MQQKINKKQYSCPHLHNVPYNVAYIEVSAIGPVLIILYTQGLILSYNSSELFQLPPLLLLSFFCVLASFCLFSFFCLFFPFSCLLYISSRHLFFFSSLPFSRLFVFSLFVSSFLSSHFPISLSLFFLFTYHSLLFSP